MAIFNEVRVMLSIALIWIAGELVPKNDRRAAPVMAALIAAVEGLSK